MQLSVIVSTYERPGHLLRCLQSLAMQQGVAGRFEVVVTDDGSTDHTASEVEQFAQTAPYPLKFITQPNEGFRLSRCRNRGVAVSQGEYLLLTDGDCLLPAHHLAQHLAARSSGVAFGGDCVRLNQQESQTIDVAAIHRGNYTSYADPGAIKQLQRRAQKAKFYEWVNHPTKPKLTGWNIAVNRSDYERVNGFDESFIGWGCEDDDFARRLRLAGVRIKTIADRTHAYHLWHPPHATAPAKWSDGVNIAKIRQPTRLPRCLKGLKDLSAADLNVRVVNNRCRWFHNVWPNGVGGKSRSRCELELLVLPGDGQFGANSQCRVVIAPDGEPVPRQLQNQADLVLFTKQPMQTADELHSEIERALGKAA